MAKKEISIDAWLAELDRLNPNPGVSPRRKFLTEEQLKFVHAARERGHMWNDIAKVLRSNGTDMHVHTAQRCYKEWLADGE